MDVLTKIFGTGNLTGEAAEGVKTLVIVAAVLLLILVVSIFSAVEQARFRSWYKRNCMLDTPYPWRTIVPWHRMGSKWFRNRAGNVGSGISSEDYSAEMNHLYQNIGKTTRVKISSHRLK